jgi:hypothetical protein
VSRERRRQPKASLARRVGVRTPRKTILIFCEGRNTEPQYFEALKREPEVRDTDNDQARRLRRELDGRQGKSITGSQYTGQRKDAARRAAKLAAFHHDNGAAVPHDNPSSGTFRLIEATLPRSESLF